MTDRSVRVNLRMNVSDYERGAGRASAVTTGLVRNLEQADGRVAAIVQSAMALAPAFVPVAATAVPAVAGLALQAGVAAGAVTTLLLAFNGVGTALKALNDYQLDPTAENLDKVHAAMNQLGPATQVWVSELQAARPELQALQNAAAEGLFGGGAIDGLHEVLELMPQAMDFVRDVGAAMGRTWAEAGDNLNDKRWVDFFTYLDHEAVPTLDAMGKTVGNLVEAGANLLQVSDPMSGAFTQGLLEWSRDFREATDNLGDSDGYQRFLAYIERNGPQALDTLGALGSALLDIVEAAAPVGEVALPIIEDLAHGLSAVAESPAGPVIIGAAAAIGTLGRSMALLRAVGLMGSGNSMMANVFGTQAAKDAVPAYRAAAVATSELAAAETAAAAAHARYIGSLKASSTMGALIPGRAASPGMEKATNSLVAANQRLATASRAAETAEARKTASIKAGLATAGKAAGVAGGLAIATSGLADGMGLSNTASMALMGTIAGPWGAAIGGGVGLAMDLAAANDSVTESLDSLELSMRSATAGDLPALTAQLDEAKRALDDYAGGIQNVADSNVNAGTYAISHPSDTLAFYKNAIEGLFGESDVEEAQARIAAIEDSLLHFKGVADEIAQIEVNADLLADTDPGKVEILNNAIASLNDETLTTAESAQRLKDALDALLGPKMNLSAATDAYTTSLRTLDDELAKSSKTLRGNSNAAIQNRAAVRDRISAIKDQLGAEADAGASSYELSQSLQEQRQRLIDAGKAAGLSKAQLQDYIHELGLTPKIVRTLVEANTRNAEEDLARALRMLNDLDGRTANAIANVTTVYRTVGNATDAFPQRGNADGGTIPGQRAPYGDKALYMLAPGEEVISNRRGQADRHRALLKAINSGAMADGGTVRGLAYGGTVSTPSGGWRMLDDDRAWSKLERHLADLADRFHEVEQRAEDVRDSMEKEIQQRDQLRSRIEQYGSAVSSSIDHDLFGNGLAGFNAQARADRNDNRAMKAALREAKRHGLSGALFAQLAASGDLDTAQQFAGLSRAQIRREERLFRQTQRAQSGLSDYAVQQKFGNALQQQNRVIDHLQHRLHELNGTLRHLGQDVKEGTREGMRDRDRAVTQRGKVGR